MSARISNARSSAGHQLRRRDLVVVALPGATLPGGFVIATRKTYGRTSDGMICSAAELGLGADHSGILVLPPGTAEPGADGAEVLGLDDVVFDLAITPDRGYCMSVRGLAREIACAYDLNFVDPASDQVVQTAAGRRRGMALTVQPETGVRRFALRPVTGIDPLPCRRGGCSAGCSCAASGRLRRRGCHQTT